jgi:hypothetical protein
LRLDPAVHDAVQRWASDELRSLNAQIEFVLRRALERAGRLRNPNPAPATASGTDPRSSEQEGGEQ